MATKKKTKATAGKRPKKSSPKKTKAIAGKKAKSTSKVKTSAKNKAKSVGLKKGKAAVAKKRNVPVNVPVNVKNRTKKIVAKKRTIKEKPLPELTTHGEDLHLIPVQGEIHPVRLDESARVEKVFKHNQDVAVQQEQQKIKAAMAMRKNVKRTFPQARQS